MLPGNRGEEAALLREVSFGPARGQAAVPLRKPLLEPGHRAALPHPGAALLERRQGAAIRALGPGGQTVPFLGRAVPELGDGDFRCAGSDP